MDLNKLMIGFIAIIVGLILMQIIADGVFKNADYSSETVDNQTVTLVDMYLGNETVIEADAEYTLTGTEVIGVTSCSMANGTLLTDTTDYVAVTTNEDAVTVTYQDTANVKAMIADNSSLCTFNRYPDAYVRGSSTARLLLRLINIFFALGVLSVGIGMIYKEVNGYFN